MNCLTKSLVSLSKLKPLSLPPFSTLQTLAKTFKTFSHIFQQCANARALHPAKQAHARMLVSGFDPTLFVSNCLIHLYLKCRLVPYAAHMFDQMPQRDTVSWNTMIFGYASLGHMGSAHTCFDAMPERDVVSWNSLLSGYLRNGECLRSVCLFVEMANAGVHLLNPTTFAVVLKACAAMEEVEFGAQVHCVAVKIGYDVDVFTGSALADMYAKCRKLNCSMRVFRELPEKNVVSWSAVIAGAAQSERFVMAVELFNELQRGGIGVSQATYASVFRSCAGLSACGLGSQLHGHAVKTRFHSDVVVGTAILDMYAKCENVADARKMFDLMPNRSLQSYNALIVGCARNGKGFAALQLFMLLCRSGNGFDEITLSVVLSACAMIKGQLEGLQLQGLAVKTGFKSNVCVANAILDMYGKCGNVLGAFRVFDEMVRRDSVSWNAIIATLEQNKNELGTLSCFVSMLRSRMEPDEFTYGSVLKACASQRSLNHGMEIHSRIIKSGNGTNLFIGGSLIVMYSKCGMMEEAEKVHHRTGQTMVSWNAIISGFSLLKKNEEAQTFFCQMLEMGVKPDNFTYATVLDTCANLATVGLGRQIHAQIIKHELQSDVYVTSTLVDMYAKCGNMQDSHLMFKKASNRDAVTWNAMISGYANYGLGEDALRIFKNMQLEDVEPNHATFVSVLQACGHTGNSEEGLYYFQTMLSEYGLKPQLEHYSCMVDIIGKSGQVDEALRLIQDMPCEPDDLIWRNLLSICKLHGNVQVAEIAASSIWQMDPQDSSTYVLLSNIYAEAGMWGEVSKMRRILRSDGMRKEPGCSWIEVKDEVHAFFVRDTAHPSSIEVYERLDLLIVEMTGIGYRPGIEFSEEMDEPVQLE